jgi:hypothetical protein
MRIPRGSIRLLQPMRPTILHIASRPAESILKLSQRITLSAMIFGFIWIVDCQLINYYKCVLILSHLIETFTLMRNRNY